MAPVAFQRLIAFLPAFLVALAMQIYAPVGSTLAIGRAERGETAVAAHCDPVGASADEDWRKPAHAPSHKDCCDLCHFVSAGAAPLPVAIASPWFERDAFLRIEWSPQADQVVLRGRATTFHARAPPATI
jgi:hypothetical protein